MFLRGFITSITDGIYKKVSGAFRFNETISTYLYQHYGFTSIPNVQTEVILLRNGVNTVIIAEDDGNNRPTAAAGEVYLYVNTKNYIKIASDGSITVKTDGKSIILDNGQGTIKLDTNGQVNINNGNLTVDV